MFDVLNTIILACQIYGGPNSATKVQQIQDSCQKKIIKCVKNKQKTKFNFQYNLLDCMEEV